jgi:hypothetical protein
MGRLGIYTPSEYHKKKKGLFSCLQKNEGNFEDSDIDLDGNYNYTNEFLDEIIDKMTTQLSSPEEYVIK